MARLITTKKKKGKKS